MMATAMTSSRASGESCAQKSISTRALPTTHAPFSPRPIHIRKDGLELRIFSTIMTLGTPRDVTLQELRIETFFPADDASERSWRRIADETRSARTMGHRAARCW